MRVGLPDGARNTSALWLTFRDGSITDQLGDPNTITKVGSPTWAAGYFQDAQSFGSGNRLTVAGSASLDFSGAFTLDAWVYSTDGTNLQTAIARRATAGGENNAWALEVKANSATFTVWNAAQTSRSTSSACEERSARRRR